MRSIQNTRIVWLCLIALCVGGCRTTQPALWNGGLPLERSQLTLEGAREAESAKFSVYAITRVEGWPDPVVMTASSPGNSGYSLKSFRRVIDEVSPASTPYLDRAWWYDRGAFFCGWTGVFAMIAASVYARNDLERNAEGATAVAGLGGWLLLRSWERQHLDQARDQYSRDLDTRIYGRPMSGARLGILRWEW